MSPKAITCADQDDSDLCYNCICGVCPGCACDCHSVDHVPNSVLKKALAEHGVTFTTLSRKQVLQKILKQDDAKLILHNAHNMYRIQETYNEDDSDEEVLRRIVQDNADCQSKKRKKTTKERMRNKARKSRKSLSSLSNARAAHLEECES